MTSLNLEKRMKEYEASESMRKFMSGIPICARVDGRCFHTFTSDLQKPFDIRLANLFHVVAKQLIEETNASIAYHQSDEITFIWENSINPIFFDGRIQKLTSVISSACSAVFNRLLPDYLPEKGYATFDCRVWQVPSLIEAANVLVWREQDCTKNAISSTARILYSQKELSGKDSKEMQEMIFEKGSNFNNFPEFFKRGKYFKKIKIIKKFTQEEIEKLPENHEVRKNPDLTFERSEVVSPKFPRISSISNKVGVLFGEETPIILGKDENNE